MRRFVAFIFSGLVTDSSSSYSGRYDVRKVDVWSAGATVWEMAESEPPFIDIEDPRQIPNKWPELSQAENFSQSLHDFLSLASSPPSIRPSAHDLLTVSSPAPSPRMSLTFCFRLPLCEPPVSDRKSLAF